MTVKCNRSAWLSPQQVVCSRKKSYLYTGEDNILGCKDKQQTFWQGSKKRKFCTTTALQITNKYVDHFLLHLSPIHQKTTKKKTFCHICLDWLLTIDINSCIINKNTINVAFLNSLYLHKICSVYDTIHHVTNHVCCKTLKTWHGTSKRS